jgi:hypothetical protein
MNGFRPHKHRDREFESHFEAWMSVCIYSVFVLFFVQVAALRRTDPPSKESYRLYKDQETEKSAKVQQRAVEQEIDR